MVMKESDTDSLNRDERLGGVRGQPQSACVNTNIWAGLYSHQREAGTAFMKTHFILMKLPEIVQLSHTR